VNEHNCKSRRWNDGSHDRRPYARAHVHDERRQFVARVSDRIHGGACRERLRVGGMMLTGRVLVAVSGTLMTGGNSYCEGIAAVHAAERSADLARHRSAENNERQREGQEASSHLFEYIERRSRRNRFTCRVREAGRSIIGNRRRLWSTLAAPSLGHDHERR